MLELQLLTLVKHDVMLSYLQLERRERLRDGVVVQVLIFSQFKIMLDVLEDYLRLAGFPFERIDGSVSQRDREAAIDRYSKGALSCQLVLNFESFLSAKTLSGIAFWRQSRRSLQDFSLQWKHLLT